MWMTRWASQTRAPHKNAKPHGRKAKISFIKRRKSDEEAEEMEEAARNDEGMVYVL